MYKHISYCTTDHISCLPISIITPNIVSPYTSYLTISPRSYNPTSRISPNLVSLHTWYLTTPRLTLQSDIYIPIVWHNFSYLPMRCNTRCAYTWHWIAIRYLVNTGYGKIRDVMSYDMCVDMRLSCDTRCGEIPDMMKYDIIGDT